MGVYKHRKTLRDTHTHTRTHLVIYSQLSLKRSHTLKHTFTLTKKGKRIRLKTTILRTTLTTGHITLRGGSQGDRNAHILAGNNVTLRFVWAVTQCRILSLHGGIWAYPGFI